MSGGDFIIGLLTGTYFAVLYCRALGANIDTDCALWAGGHTNLLFTEPNILALENRAAVDDASLVAYLNLRGNFFLNVISVGDRSVLESGSRLLSGATMGADACLLEHRPSSARQRLATNSSPYRKLGNWPLL